MHYDQTLKKTDFLLVHGIMQRQQYIYLFSYLQRGKFNCKVKITFLKSLLDLILVLQLVTFLIEKCR